MNRIFSGGAQGGGIEGNNDLGMQQQRQPNFDAGGGFGMGNSRGGYNGQDLLRQSSSQSSNSVVQQTANMDPNDRVRSHGFVERHSNDGSKHDYFSSRNGFDNAWVKFELLRTVVHEFFAALADGCHAKARIRVAHYRVL